MNAHGPYIDGSRREFEQLSVFMTPWMKPTQSPARRTRSPAAPTHAFEHPRIGPLRRSPRLDSGAHIAWSACWRHAVVVSRAAAKNLGSAPRMVASDATAVSTAPGCRSSRIHVLAR
jgi:hypothetical protein